MKKLLYIPVNSKPEGISTSKKMGRQFVNSFLAENPDYMIEELDLFNEFIPEINHRLLKGWVELVSGPSYDALSIEDKKAVDKINDLINQFLLADIYVIAAPMWSLSFPYKLKQYIDCIVLNNRLISLKPEEIKGLLDNKDRAMVYIQSAGGIYPKIFTGAFNPGVDYVQDLFKFLGIKRFEKILIQGNDMHPVDKQEEIDRATKDIDKIVKKLKG